MDDGRLLSRPVGRGAFVIAPLRGCTGALLAGKADYTVRGTLRAALAMLVASGEQDLHLDLAELDFMDVYCTRELIAFVGRHPAVRLFAYHPPASMRRIIAILHPEVKIVIIDTCRPGTGEANGQRGRVSPRRPSAAMCEGAPTPDIVELILGEHVRIRKLIGELRAALLDGDLGAPGSEPAPTWAALARFLSFHVDAAGEIVYRALAEAVPDAAAVVTRASETDADIRAAVGEARLSRPGSLAWRMAVEAASSAAESHIVLLESGLLPRCRQHAPREARRVLGRQWEAFMADRVLDAAACLGRQRAHGAWLFIS